MLDQPTLGPHDGEQPGSALDVRALDLVLRRAVEGDEGAFADLYREVHPRLRRYGLSLVGQDAEDVVAEAWLQIARDLRRFSGGSADFRAWSARIVRNRAMDHLRARSRRPADPVPTSQLPAPMAADDTATAALDQLSADAAIRFIGSVLPHDQAEAVMLRAIVGLDAAAAGQLLGKSAAAVRVSAHRGLKTLAKHLAKSGAQDRQSQARA